jgi:replicative DNA helicase
LDQYVPDPELAREINSGNFEMDFARNCWSIVPSPTSGAIYAREVAENYRKRELRRCLSNADLQIKNHADSRDVWIELTGKTTDLFRMKDKRYTAQDYTTDLEKNRKSGHYKTPWGINSLDTHISGFTPGSIIVIGADPGHGKSALAIQLADGWAASGHKILFQSLEMRTRDIYDRRMAAILEKDIDEITEPKRSWTTDAADIKYWEDIHRGSKIISQRESQMFFDDTPALSPEEVALNIRMAHDAHGIDFFIIDYFLKMQFKENRDMRHSYEDGFELIASTCKTRDITPVILSQLRKPGESRRQGKPSRYDIRECARLGEAADIVLLLYRKYNETKFAADYGFIDIICDKNRTGREAEMRAKFIPTRCQFGDDIIVKKENGK